MAEKIICHICGRKFKEKGFEVSSCPRCAADLRNEHHEHIILSERGGLLAKGAVKGNYSGILILTDKRIVFVHDSSSRYVIGFFFGVLGSALAMAATSGGSKKPAITLQRTDITSAAEGKRALARMLDITTKDGTLYRLSIPKKRIEDWLERLAAPVAW